VPDDLMKEWLQHLRDFDAKHPQCHFQIMVDAPDIPMDKMIDLVKVDPALDFTTIIERQKRI
jgi:hypothetical protein